MKKLLILCCLLGASLITFASKIDSLNNEADVKAFLLPLLAKSFYDGAGTNWQVKTWQKFDFNNDNQQDLLVAEKVDFQTFNFVVMANAGENYRLLRINYDSEGESANAIKIIDKSYIIFHGFKTSIAPTSKVPRTDTLTYQYGAFVELNKSPAHYSISSITYSTFWGWHGWDNTPPQLTSHPDNVLEIDNGVKAVYTMNRSNVVYIVTNKKRPHNPEGDPGVYRGKIKKDVLKDVYDLINYIDIKKLEDKYAIHYTDHTSFYITIKFTDGSTKTIADYGGKGTFGLQALFSNCKISLKLPIGNKAIIIKPFFPFPLFPSLNILTFEKCSRLQRIRSRRWNCC